MISDYKKRLSYLAVAGAAAYYGASKYIQDSKIQLVVGQKDSEEGIEKLLEQCPSLTSNEAKLLPTPYLCNGILQTIYCTKIALTTDKQSDITYDRESMTMSDEGTVSLDWYPERTYMEKAERKGKPIVLVVPGLGGSAYEYHVRCTVKQLADNLNVQTVVCNHRGSGRTPLTSPRLYNAYDTSDLQAIIKYMGSKYPESRLLCVGYSMGANLITRYLGEFGDEAKLHGAVAISCPFDTFVAGKAMNARGYFNDWLFQPNLMATIKRVIRRNLQVVQTSPLNYDIDAIMKAKRMMEVDNLVTARAYGHQDCWDYYKAASSAEFVDGIKRPFLAINAEDDPVTPVDGVPQGRFAKNPMTALALVKHGGHIGFFTGVTPRIWYIDPVVEFFQAVLQ
ncbi:hypothetical protein H4R22_002104 [Coemansia sp. RSA 1290]|nr:hypothetical protein LPJ68_000566 [Coemansia sp. RSA 1086]KAJ1874388.1 hypothetical protein LPJ55_001505 [Coemansia sp. RSA 990]KAJ2631262.1 hypothetical protein H4R22_002104 [Coemansia sp. RSA 1290]KAJ2650004.1 hypothetical protein IWW40_002714 [Coemansia sp. RSA 1250]